MPGIAGQEGPGLTAQRGQEIVQQAPGHGPQAEVAVHGGDQPAAAGASTGDALQVLEF